jgi:hypothetical protein
MSQVVSALDGNTFAVSDRTGNVAGSPSAPHGLFFNDTRFLSRWVLTINGQLPGVLSVDDLNYFSVSSFSRPRPATCTSIRGSRCAASARSAAVFTRI